MPSFLAFLYKEWFWNIATQKLPVYFLDLLFLIQFYKMLYICKYFELSMKVIQFLHSNYCYQMTLHSRLLNFSFLRDEWRKIHETLGLLWKLIVTKLNKKIVIGYGLNIPSLQNDCMHIIEKLSFLNIGTREMSRYLFFHFKSNSLLTFVKQSWFSNNW